MELRKKYERARGDLKQRTVDVHMLQARSCVYNDALYIIYTIIILCV